MSLVWLITGCSSGFGYELASQALQAGHKVVATSRNPGRTPELVSKFEALGGTWLPLDLSRHDTATSAVERTLEIYGRIDVLVNNAGYAILGPLESISDDEGKALMDTNFHGPLRMMQLVLPYMRQQRSGVIVNMSSIAGLDISLGNVMYAASKHALEAASQGLMGELAPFGIHVLLVEPGNFRTTFLDSYQTPKKDLSREYQDTPVSDMLVRLRQVSGKQPGDIKKGCKLIVQAVTRSGPFEGQEWLPRLPLGADCVQRAFTKLDSVKDNFVKLQRLAESTDIDE